MQEEPRFLLIDTRVLPDVFLRVAEAKRLLAAKEVKNASEAARAVGISRSALYKYKDFVFTRPDEDDGRALTFVVSLKDNPGVLQELLSVFFCVGANVLSINQNIPVDSVAPVSISLRTNQMNCSEEELLEKAKKLPGVLDIKFISGH